MKVRKKTIIMFRMTHWTLDQLDLEKWSLIKTNFIAVQFENIRFGNKLSMKDGNTKMINISSSVLNSAYTGASSQPVWYAGSEDQGYAPVV